MKNIKNMLGLFFILLLGSCSTLTKTDYFNPDFFVPVVDTLYTLDNVSYAFYPKEERVLINTKMDPTSSGWYKLEEPTYIGTNSAVFRLSGWGNYNNTFFGIRIIPNDPKSSSKPSIVTTIQSTEAFAKNVIESLSGSDSSRLIKGVPLVSPAMFAASSIETWTKTSISGIYNPEDTEFQSFEYENHISAEFKTKMIVTTPDFEQGTQKVETNELLFVTNVGLTGAVYSYTETVSSSSKHSLLALVLDMNSKEPRANMYYQEMSATGSGIANSVEIKEIMDKITRNVRWEYGVLAIAEKSDGSLIPLGKNVKWTYVDINNLRNPQNEETWSFDPNGNTALLTIGGKGTIKDYNYILENTSTSNIFKLLDEDPTTQSKYNGYYFAFIMKSDKHFVDFILDRSLQNVAKKLSDKTGTKYKKYTEAGYKKPQFKVLEVFKFKTNNTDIKLSGAGVALVSNDIYVVGGFMDAYNIANVKPWDITNTVIGGSTKNTLINVNTTLFKISDLSSTLKIEAMPQRLLVPNAGVGGIANKAHMQQGQLIPLQSGLSTILYGFGSGGVDPNNVRLYTQNLSAVATQWTGITVTSPMINRYHFSVIGLSNAIYLYGGIIGKDGDVVGSVDLTEPIILKDDFWKSTDGGTSWTLVKDSITGRGRVHAKLFTIQDDLYIVGGIEPTTGNVMSYTALKDVWKSSDGGKTWTQIEDVKGLPITTNGMIAGTSYGSLLFMVDEDRMLYYSADGGKTWENSLKVFAATVGSNIPTSKDQLFGARLIVHDNYLYLIGGQWANLESSDDWKKDQRKIDSNIYRLQFVL